jgi:hypothetical protein
LRLPSDRQKGDRSPFCLAKEGKVRYKFRTSTNHGGYGEVVITAGCGPAIMGSNPISHPMSNAPLTGSVLQCTCRAILFEKESGTKVEIGIYYGRKVAIHSTKMDAYRNNLIERPTSAESMKPIHALKIVFCIAVFGLLFSGVLTYQEVFGSAALSCPAPGAPGTVFGYPACVYGFFMYLVIVIISALGLFSKKTD